MSWPEIVIGEYSLYTHPELTCLVEKNGPIQLVLIGQIFDWKAPDASNAKILSDLSKAKDFEELVRLQNDLCGHYILIYADAERLNLFNDAGAQAEVYYDTQFEVFASQISLMRELKTINHSEDPVIRDFYQSAVFKKQKLSIGSTTPFEGIKHLMPNHFLDIASRQMKRFYPSETLISQETEKVASEAAKMIKGFVQAMLRRNQSVMGVTAGYDSRVLFLASQGEACDYYVSRHASMKDDHYDLVIPENYVATTKSV